MFAEIKRLFKHTSVYSIGTIAQRSVAFLLLPIYTRYITPSDYGILEILVVTGQILSIFYSLAMYSGFSRTFLCDCKDEVDKKETLATALVFVLLFSAFMLIVTFCFINPLNNLLFKGEDYTAYIKIILLTCFLSTLAVIPSAYLVATEKSLIFIIISFIQTLFNLSINIYLVAFLRLGIKGIILGNLLAQGSAGAILTTIFLLKIGITIKIYWLKKMLSFALPMIGSYLASFILDMSDRYLLARLADLHELGLYGVGYKIGMIIQVLIVVPFMQAYAPFSLSIAKKENHKEIYQRIFKYTALVFVLISLLISLYAKEILTLIVAPKFVDAYKVVFLVAISYTVYGTCFVLAAGINIAGKSQYFAIATTIGAISNIILNLLLIPKFGMIGAALATLLAYSLVGLSLYILAQRLYYIPYKTLKTIFIFIIGGIIYFISCMANQQGLIISISVKTLLLLMILVIFYLFFLDIKEKNKLKYLAYSILDSYGKRGYKNSEKFI